jgi:hypothetical protein
MESTTKTTARRKTSKAVAKPPTSQGPSPTHTEIALRAHELYLQSGCQSGRDKEFWLEAERQLQGGHKK